MEKYFRNILPGVLVILFMNAGISARPDDRRSRIESTYNDYIDSHKFLVEYVQAKKYFSDVARESEKYEYWDICVGALSMIAYIADLNYHHDVMKDAILKGNLIMEQKSAELDSLDPQFYIRAEMTMMIGSYYVRNCELKHAAEIFHSLIDRLNETKNPDKSSIYKSYSFLADLYIDMGLYDKVDSYYQLMQKSLPENDDLYAYIYLQYLASSYNRNRKFDRAESILKETFRMTPAKLSERWKPYVISNYKMMASLYQRTNRFDSAKLCLNYCLKNLRPGDPSVIDIYELYGDGLSHTGKYNEALVYFHRIESIINNEKTFNISRKAQVLSKIADTYLRQGEYKEAILSAQKAFMVLYKDSAYLNQPFKNPAFSTIQPDKIIIGLLITKSNALYESSKNNKPNSNHYNSILNTYQLTTRIIEKFRHMISTDDFKEFFVMNVRQMYENAISACYNAYEYKPGDSIIGFAYYFIEKSKNQVLLDAIRQNQARKFGNIPDSLVEKEYRYKSQLVKMQNDLYELNFQNADPEIIKNCQFESARIQNDYSGFLKKIEKQFPEYYKLKYSNEIPDIQDIKKIARKRILIEYLDGENSIALIAFSRDQTVFKVFHKNTEYNSSLNDVLQALYNSDNLNRYDPANYRKFINQSFWLYEKLLKPALSQFKHAEELILIPDGKLCYLPFEALISKTPQNTSNVAYEKLDYLIRDFTVRYEYSAGLLNFKRGTVNTLSNDVYSGFAPIYGENSALNEVRVLGKKAGFLSSLKYNVEEIKNASGIFKGKAYLGKDATESRFRNSISSRIVHFAGHTIINDSIPELSGMFFSGDGKMNGSNGVLYLDEMFNLDMNTQLAILSGCETGYGRLLKGEGLSSIGRAFKYAGCNDLVMTLWKINDRSASALIRKFCLNLRKGLPTAAALRKSKTDCLNSMGSSRPSNPFYWSAFILIGSNEPLFHRNVIWIITVISATAFLLAFFIARSHLKRAKINRVSSGRPAKSDPD
jgi:CHAT domain-containing protein/tetratricopeptide (TPR) repeat protein